MKKCIESQVLDSKRGQLYRDKKKGEVNFNLLTKKREEI